MKAFLICLTLLATGSAVAGELNVEDCKRLASFSTNQAMKNNLARFVHGMLTGPQLDAANSDLRKKQSEAWKNCETAKSKTE